MRTLEDFIKTPGQGLSMEEILSLMSSESEKARPASEGGGEEEGGGGDNVVDAASTAIGNQNKPGGETTATKATKAKYKKAAAVQQEKHDTSPVEEDAAILMSKAAEMFILELTMNAWQTSSVYSTADGGGHSLKASESSSKFSFSFAC